MQLDLLQCSFCSNSFDLELSLPIFLISCPHSLCLKCLNLIFTLHPPQKRQCPICSVGLLPGFSTPEAFPNDSNVLNILQIRQKQELQKQNKVKKERREYQKLIKDLVQQKQSGDSTELNSKRALDVENHQEVEEELIPENTRKKLKTEQEIDDELTKLQEIMMNQFTEMRKMLHTSRNTGTEARFPVIIHKRSVSKSTVADRSDDGESEFILRREHSDRQQNEHPLVEITSKLKGMFAETQEALDKLRAPVEIEVSEEASEKGSEKASENSFEHIRILNSVSSVDGKEEVEEAASSILEFTIHDEINLQPSEIENKAVENEKKMQAEEFKQEEKQEEEEKVQLQQQVDDEKEKEKEEEETLKMVTKKKNRSKFKLDLSGQEISQNILEDSCQNIKRRKIKRFDVSFSASSLTDQLFANFAQMTFPVMKSLTSILINFAETRISSETFQLFSQKYLQNYNLKNFVFNCSGTSISEEALKSLDESLGPSVPTLENIELVFNSTDIDGEQFLDALYGMDQLKHLKLSFENALITLEVFSSVMFCLSFLAQNLETLELNFNGIEIHDESFGSFSNAVFQMGKLKHFKLCLGATLISNDFLFDLFQNLSSHASRLENFELDLSETELSNRAFKQFCDSILSEMVNLENLKLNLSGTSITDFGLKSLLLPVKKLKSVFLNLSDNKIHDAGLKTFKENNTLKYIRSVDVKVEGTSVTNEALQGFLDYVKTGHEPKAPPTLNKTPSQNKNSSQDYPEKRKNSNKGKDDSTKENDNSNKDKNPMNICSPEQARDVLLELKAELAVHYGSKATPSKLGSKPVRSYIQRLEPEAYDSMLKKVLLRIFSVSQVETKELEDWKKLIQIKLSSSLVQDSVKKQRRKNKEAKEKSGTAIVQINQDNSIIPAGQSIQAEQEQSLRIIDNKTEQILPIIEIEENKNSGLGDIKIKTEHGYMNIEKEQSYPPVKTEQDHINIKAEQNHCDMQIESSDDIPQIEEEEDTLSVERSQDDFPSEIPENPLLTQRKREIFNIVDRYTNKKQNVAHEEKIPNIPAPERISSSNSNETQQNYYPYAAMNPYYYHFYQNQYFYHMARMQHMRNAQAKEGNTSAGLNPNTMINTEKIQHTRNSEVMVREQRNQNEDRKIFSIKRNQDDFNMQKKHNASEIERIQDESGIRITGNTFNIEKMQSVNIEAKPKHLNEESDPNRVNNNNNTKNDPSTAREQNDFNVRMNQNAFTIERVQHFSNTQNHLKIEESSNIKRESNNSSSTDKKYKIFKIIRKQKKTAIVKTQKPSLHSLHKIEKIKKILRSREEVFSFQWMKRYAREILLREKIIEILKSMKNPYLNVLYKKLLEYIQQQATDYPTWRMPEKIKSPSYLYNWWSRLIAGEQEIKHIWKSTSPSKLPSIKPKKEQPQQFVERVYGFKLV